MLVPCPSLIKSESPGAVPRIIFFLFTAPQVILKSTRIENPYATLLLLFKITKWAFKCVSCKWLNSQYKCLLLPHCNYIHNDLHLLSLSVGCLLNKRLQVFCIFVNRSSKPGTKFDNRGAELWSFRAGVALVSWTELLINDQEFYRNCSIKSNLLLMGNIRTGSQVRQSEQPASVEKRCIPRLSLLE